jgi:hypothetical protein
MSLAKKMREATEKQRIAVHIEEVGETIYIEPMTVGDLTPSSKYQLQTKECLTDLEKAVMHLIHKSVLEDGSPAFSADDYETLLNCVSQDLVINILNVAAQKREEESKKKSSEAQTQD